MRQIEMKRETRETQIRVVLDLDGTGNAEIRTGIAFFDHMLHACVRHGRFDLVCQAHGDLSVDYHHTIEDVGIVLGDAIKNAIGEGRDIRRFAHAMVPMDEAIATVAIDCAGRGYLVYRGQFNGTVVGGLDREIIEHFFYSVCSHAGITAHIIFSGKNDHHQCEAIFKAFGIALGEAVLVGPGGSGDIPSTKGVL
jgi:imidazoleglycerol phosphate dehydratase HisB